MTKRYPRVKKSQIKDQNLSKDWDKKEAYQKPEPQPGLDQTEYLNMEDYLKNKKDHKAKRAFHAEGPKKDQTEELPPSYGYKDQDTEDLDYYEDEDYFYYDEEDEDRGKGCFGISCGFALFLVLVALASIILAAYLAFR